MVLRARFIAPAILAAMLLCASPLAAQTQGAAPDAAAAPSQKEFPEFIFDLPKEQKDAMDLNPDTFRDFWKNWHFVATRWRQDVHEFRMTYANDLAWKTLNDQRTDYPVGAMFGKLVYPAEEDLALPSSVLPANLLTRMMVMLWDPKHKHASADGWVYLRYINRKPGVPQDKNSTGIWGVMSDKEVKACVECHARAYDRGYVFSQPTFLFRADNAQALKYKSGDITESRVGEVMTPMKPHDVPRIARSLIESIAEWKDRAALGYAGNFFAGALGEMRPVLMQLAQKNPDKIYIVFDRDDPNTIEVASSITKKDHENCAGVVHLRGTLVNPGSQDVDTFRRVVELTLARQKRDAGRPPAKQDAKSDAKPDTKPAGKVPDTKANVLTPEETEATDFADYGDAKQTQGVVVRDMEKQYKPAAVLTVSCGKDMVLRQFLPLLYTAQDADGLPAYYFAPAIKN